MTDREAQDLNRRVARLSTRGRGKRFPAVLRERISAWVRTRRDRGDWWCELAREVGVPAATLKRWAAPRADCVVEMRPVDVIDAPPVGTVTLVSPTGLRIEGVAIADAIAILRGIA